MCDIEVAGPARTRWRDASILLLGLASLVLVGCGGGERTAAEAAEAPRWTDVDACRLLTRDDVQDVVGTIVREASLASSSDGSTRCVWTAELGPPAATLFVSHEPASVPPGKEALDAAAESGDPEVIPKLGSAALWNPNLGDLQVWAYGQKLQIGNPGITRAEALELSRRALARMAGF